MPSDDTADTLPPDAAPSTPAWLDAHEAAARAHLSVRTLRNAVAAGELVPDGRGRGPLFRPATIDAWLEARARRRS